ncbi:MAG: RNA-binding protein [Oscillospiraceae bacterium]|nr:RNA-binding protein [Oscillospiraceae bacterium]
MEHTDLLLGHMEDLADKAVKTGCAASRFLTPAEAQSVSARLTRRHDVALSFDGGYDGAERTRAVLQNPDWGEWDRAGLFAVLKAEYRSRDTLGHRDVLGALMALGIERDTIGDIMMDEHFAVLVCLPELGGYVAENLTKAGRVGVSVSEIGLGELPAKQEELTVKTDTVASLRLDAVLSAAFGLSRTKAAGLIAAGRVNLDHQLCLQPAKELGEGSLLSVRGLGRAKLLEAGERSKKGRIFVSVGLYGR